MELNIEFFNELVKKDVQTEPLSVCVLSYKVVNGEITEEPEDFCSFAFPANLTGHSELMKDVSNWAKAHEDLYKQYLEKGTTGVAEYDEIYNTHKENSTQLLSDREFIAIGSIKHTFASFEMSDTQALGLFNTRSTALSLNNYVQQNITGESMANILKDIKDAKKS